MVIQKRFKGVIRKSGNSYVITIPSFLLRSELFKIKQEIDVTLTEIPENDH